MQEVKVHIATKLVPQLRFKEFEGAWDKPKLSERMEIFRGASPRPKGDPRYYGGDIPRLMIQDVTRDGKYAYPCIQFLTEEGAKKSRLLKKGSIVLSCSGTRVAIPGILGIDACIHDGWLAFRNYKNIETDFLYNLFVKLHERMQGSATTGGVFNNLTTSIVRDLRMGFPSLPEQQKIASFLSAVDEKIQQLTKKKDLLEQYKKGVMQQLFSGQLRFKDENGNQYPDWGENKLGELTSLLKDGTHGTHKDTPGSDYYLLSAKNIKNGSIFIDESDRRISEEEYNGIYKNYCLKENDILLTVVGTIGRIAKFGKETNIAFQRSVAFFRFENDNPDYLLQFMFGVSFQKELDKRKVVSAQPGVYLGDLAKISIQRPCIEEQQKIATYLSRIDTKIGALNNQITQTQTFKKGLLQQMFV